MFTSCTCFPGGSGRWEEAMLREAGGGWGTRLGPPRAGRRSAGFPSSLGTEGARGTQAGERAIPGKELFELDCKGERGFGLTLWAFPNPPCWGLGRAQSCLGALPERACIGSFRNGSLNPNLPLGCSGEEDFWSLQAWHGAHLARTRVAVPLAELYALLVP